MNKSFKKSFKKDKDEWSDDENEELKYKLMVGRKDIKLYVPSDLEQEARLLNLEQEYLVDTDNKLSDYKRSKFSGDVKLDGDPVPSPDKVEGREREGYARRTDFTIDRPQVHQHTERKLGNAVLDYLWQQFLDFGCDESELLELRHLPVIFANLSREQGHALPLEDLSVLRKMDHDDYIEYSRLCNEITMVTSETLSSQLNGTWSPPVTPIKNANDLQVQLGKYINDENGTEEGDRIDDNFEDGELYRIKVVYSTFYNELRGKIRIRHIFEMMHQLGYKLEKERLPKKFWENHSEYVLGSVDELKNLILELKVVVVERVDPLAHLFHYPLPGWLQKEFKASEILLYQHHFSLTDRDGGGEVDSEELQFLLEQFGSNVTLEEAQEILNEFDMDGGGTMDFVEFMVLIYRMQKGTINITNNKLAQAVVEVKSQLRIFEEIEMVQRRPPPYCKVLNFGGAIVTCDFLICGPEDSAYAGGKFVLQMTINDGYPYSVPDVKFLTRIYGINMISMVDGTTRYPNFRECIWNPSWTMEKLLLFAVDQFRYPCITMLPSKLEDVFEAWVSEANTMIAMARKKGGVGRVGDVQDPHDLKTLLDQANAVLNKPSYVQDGKDSDEPITMATLSSEAHTKRMIGDLTRVEQAHLQVLFHYLADRPTYNKLVSQFCQMYVYKEEVDIGEDENEPFSFYIDTPVASTTASHK